MCQSFENFTTFSPLSVFFLIALGLGQDLTLHFITGRRNIQKRTKTTGSSEGIIVASGGPIISGAVEGASFLVDATSVVVGGITTTTTTTIAQTGKTGSSILRSISSSSSSILTIHEDDRTMCRSTQEAPLRVSLIALTDPLLLYPDTHSVLPPPHTPPLQNAIQPRWWLIKTLKMSTSSIWLPMKSKREEGEMRSQGSVLGYWQEMLEKVQTVGKLRGPGRA